jgi:hypothetical protein
MMSRSREYWMDYATHAFVRYAKLGCPSTEEYALSVSGRADAYGRILDVDAVNRVLDVLALRGRDDVIGAIRAVYFVSPQGKPRHGAITMRARRYAVDCPADERTVYRWLKMARRMFAEQRKLALYEADEEW